MRAKLKKPLVLLLLGFLLIPSVGWLFKFCIRRMSSDMWIYLFQKKQTESTLIT